MGGGESKEQQEQMQVEEIRKSSVSKSPRTKNAKPAKSPEKPAKSPPTKRKVESASSEVFPTKTSESMLMDNANTRHSEETAELPESRSKKKIKSVRKLPPGGLEQHREAKEVIDEVDELRNSSGRYDRKAKNENREMQKLIRIYDLG